MTPEEQAGEQNAGRRTGGAGGGEGGAGGAVRRAMSGNGPNSYLFSGITCPWPRQIYLK